jgi:lambda repressor-like predicted transcriptional regulator
MYSNLTDFEKWLSHEIKAQGINVRKLAKISGVHYNTIRNYLAHRCEPSFFNVLLIVKALGYEVEAVKR